MKKLLCLLLALFMMLAVCACSDDDEKKDEGETEATVNETKPENVPDTENKPEADDKQENTIKNNAKIESYIALYEEELLSSMEESFATSSGMTCSSSVEVKGNGFIITIKINELENVDSATKKQLQDTYDEMNDTFVESLELMQSDLPELEYFDVLVCEKDGDLLATIHAEGTSNNTVSNGNTGSSDNMSKIEQYIEENQAELLSSMEESFATSSGMTCSSSIKVKGNGFIITIKINELDNLDSATKNQMQDAYDDVNATFVDSLELMQSELPELEYFDVLVCEKDGDLIATIHAEN